MQGILDAVNFKVFVYKDQHDIDFIHKNVDKISVWEIICILNRNKDRYLVECLDKRSSYKDFYIGYFVEMLNTIRGMITKNVEYIGESLFKKIFYLVPGRGSYHNDLKYSFIGRFNIEKIKGYNYQWTGVKKPLPEFFEIKEIYTKFPKSYNIPIYYISVENLEYFTKTHFNEIHGTLPEPVLDAIVSKSGKGYKWNFKYLAIYSKKLFRYYPKEDWPKRSLLNVCEKDLLENRNEVDWDYLSSNRRFSLGFIKNNDLPWNWENLQNNKHLQFNFANHFHTKINKITNIDKVDYKLLNMDNHGFLEIVEKCKLDFEFVDKYKSIIDFNRLSFNYSIHQKIVDKYSNENWNWENISKYLRMNSKFIVKHKDKLNLNLLTTNKNLPLELVEKLNLRYIDNVVIYNKKINDGFLKSIDKSYYGILVNNKYVSNKFILDNYKHFQIHALKHYTFTYNQILDLVLKNVEVNFYTKMFKKLNLKYPYYTTKFIMYMVLGETVHDIFSYIQ